MTSSRETVAGRSLPPLSTCDRSIQTAEMKGFLFTSAVSGPCESKKSRSMLLSKHLSEVRCIVIGRLWGGV
jgi:hypothetical protein